MPKRKILLTGGHLGPLLSTLSGLDKEKFAITIVGRQFTFDKNITPSLEHQLLHQVLDYKYFTLNTGRFTKGNFFSVPKQIIRTIGGIFQAFSILKQSKPDLVISFGGYLSVPICLAAKLKGIEIRLHEQTVNPGRANLLIARLSQKVFATFKQSLGSFPKNKTKLIGIALHLPITSKQPKWFKPSSLPLLLILGGSSGSHSINELISRNLIKLHSKFQVVHQLGENSFNDYQKACKNKVDNYFPAKYLWPEQIAYFYQKADLVVSRSGANTFFEIIKFKKPCVLIPLPWSFNNEQLAQANILEKGGVGYIFNQTDSSQLLYETIIKAYKNKKLLQDNFKNLKEFERLIISPKTFANELVS